MTPDQPEEPPVVGGTPAEVPEPPAPEPPASGFPQLDDLPAPPPQVSLINDDDLTWLDKPQKSDEELDRRNERKEAHKRKVRRKRRTRTALKVGGVALAVLLVLGVIWFEWTFSGLERMPSTVGQAGLNTPGTTMLLVGSNPEEPTADSITGTGWKHDLLSGDMVMLLHLTRDKRSMYVVSIPATSILPIPGVGPGTLREAYQKGGQDLYVRTIETYSGVALDRIAVMDMNALREITDQLGGVILDVPRAACGVPAGARRLDGKQSLEYMALAPCLPRKDLDRVERQQSLLRAVMRSAVDGGKLANPFRLQKILRATASNLTLEKGFSYPSMLGTLLSMRHLRTSNTTFLTIPVAAQPYVVLNGAPAIRLDPTKDAALWDALKQDQIANYLSTNTDAVVLR